MSRPNHLPGLADVLIVIGAGSVEVSNSLRTGIQLLSPATV